MSRRLAVKGKDGKGKRVSVSLQQSQDTAKKLISIIIPTKNEEKYLPQLLESIKKQTVQPYEIIVADAGSTDRTVEIAKKYGAKVVKGGLPGVGRNNGARAAKGDIFVFLDADTVLPKKSFLGDLVRIIMSERKPVIFRLIVKPYAVDLNTTVWKRWVQYASYYWSIVVLFMFKVLGQVSPTGLIAVTREQFIKTGMFKEDHMLGEDSEYGARLRKNFGITTLPYPLIVSSRRCKDFKVLLGWILISPFWLIMEVLKTIPLVNYIYFGVLRWLGVKVHSSAGSKIG